MDILSARKFTVESRTADTISGSVTAEENGYICFSIPAEQGFQVWVDGEKTDYALLADGLMAVPLTGDTGDNGDMQDVRNIHEIRLVYKAPGLKAGLCLSAAGVLLYILIYGRNSAKRREREMTGNIIIGQSGGPTAVINSSAAGVYKAAKTAGVKKVYGMIYGIQGFMEDKILDMDEYLSDDEGIELLKRTPAAFLGSCRYKMPPLTGNEEIYEKYLREWNSMTSSASFI